MTKHKPDYARIAALEQELLDLKPETTEKMSVRAAHLRSEGLTYRQIAEELYVSEYSARYLAQQGLMRQDQLDSI